MDTTAAGVLWAGTTDGHLIAIEPDGRTRDYKASDGLNGGVVRAWHLDDDGSLWLAGVGGLTLFKDGVFYTSRHTHGNALELLTAIIGDADGRIWIAMRSGLLRVMPSDLREHMQVPVRQVPLAFLNKGDGLAGNPRWYGHRGAILDEHERLWFVTSRGLSIVDPRAIGAPTPVEARVDSVVVDGQVVTQLADARLAPGTRRLDIQFAALALTTPANLRFRYRLDGFDRDWVDAGAQRSALYTNLEPGPYTFHVMATNTDGTWPEHAASWTFAAEPMFYQTVWFRVVCLSTVVGLLAITWRLHLRRVRAEMAILLAERARVAREIHDTLLQGLFGVALRCDAIAAEVHANAPQVSSQLLDMRRGVEQYVREARQSILGLRSPVLQDLGLATALKTTGEQLAAGSHVRFEFASAGRCRASDAYTEEQLLRIGQEAIVNAVRHAHATAVRAELRYRADDIVLVVADDGKGLSVDSIQGDGLGLASMRDRARATGGRVEINSQAGHGTRIEVTVPYGPSDAAA
jgi:signal transduction histidine kinase